MASPQPLRLAVLECDNAQPNTVCKYTNYTGVFTSLLDDAASSSPSPAPLSSLLTISTYNILNHPNTYPSLDDIDAILLTGSRHTAFDSHPWILKLLKFVTQALDTNRIKVVGICFGHQIIGRALGAGVEKSDKGWEVAVTEVELNDAGKEFFGKEKLRLHQMHRDIVNEFPKDAIPLGSNAFCQVQAMYKPGQYFSVQGHPEFTEDIISEILVNRHRAGIFDDAVYDVGIATAPNPHDGVVVGRAILKFICGEE
ncbi:hypothetical protein E4U52_001586 [Claviceps spartinae]|nr:hypothetical protein E4U52_001586 [Claviceps spartinae]